MKLTGGDAGKTKAPGKTSGSSANMPYDVEKELAEGAGFEPADPCGSPVFKTGAFSRARPPLRIAARDLRPPMSAQA